MSDVLLHDLSQRLQHLFEAEEDYEAGFALGRHILRTYPRHLHTYTQLGQAALAVGLYADAADILRRALSADPESATLWVGLRRAAGALGLDEEAAQAGLLAHDLSLPAAAGETHPARLARGAAAEGHWSQALRFYRRAYELAPQRFDLALGLATAFARLGREEAARTLAENVLAKLPYCLKAHWLMVRCAGAGEDRLGTQMHLRTARSLDPDDGYAWRWFADAGEPHPPYEATLPAWDESERWPFAVSS